MGEKHVGTPVEPSSGLPQQQALLARSRLAGMVAVGAVVLLVAFGFAVAAGLFRSGLTPTEIVDLQQGEAPFAGFRRAHAKGVCIEGQFQSSGALAPYSRAALLQPGASTPFVGRFSIGGNNPTAPDLKAGVRSLALDFRLADGQRWRTAMNTPPVLAVRDPQAFYDMIAAGAPDPATGKPDPERIAAFVAAHPEGAAFRAWQKDYRPTGSFATERYHSINAFWLTDAEGNRRAVRWEAEPLADSRATTPAGVAEADALQGEIAARVGRGLVQFRLKFILAGPNDPVTDPTAPWPASRKTVDAGLVQITRVTPQHDGACNSVNFDPLVLPDGIAATADPILHARSSAYAVSHRRRAQETAMGAAK